MGSQDSAEPQLEQNPCRHVPLDPGPRVADEAVHTQRFNALGFWSVAPVTGAEQALTDDVQDALWRAHVAICPKCPGFLESMGGTVRTLGETAPGVAPEGMKADILSRFAARKKRDSGG